MRRTTLYVCSTAHLLVAERDAIDMLIACGARGRDGRIVIKHSELAIEPHRFGFFVHIDIDDLAIRPPGISPELWTLIRTAHAGGADWILFDRDEPPRASLPTFP